MRGSFPHGRVRKPGVFTTERPRAPGGTAGNRPQARLHNSRTGQGQRKGPSGREGGRQKEKTTSGKEGYAPSIKRRQSARARARPDLRERDRKAQRRSRSESDVCARARAERAEKRVGTACLWENPCTQHCPFRIWPSVRSELLLLVGLVPLLFARLDQPSAPRVLACDASELGLGVCSSAVVPRTLSALFPTLISSTMAPPRAQDPRVLPPPRMPVARAAAWACAAAMPSQIPRTIFRHSNRTLPNRIPSVEFQNPKTR